MTTIADEQRSIAAKPRERLLKGRDELLRKIDAQITSLQTPPFDPRPRFITIITALGTYKLINSVERLTAFRIKAAQSPGWTGKHKEHADTYRAEWKRNGCRSERSMHAFKSAVEETADAEKDVQSQLTHILFCLEQAARREERLEREHKETISEREELKRKFAQLKEKHHKALLESANARGECAQFEEYLQEKRNAKRT